MIYKRNWDKSYKKKENTLFYPDEYLIRFVNKYIKKRQKLIVKKKNNKFLDIGCGVGRNVKYLVENGFKVTGIDISTVAINNAKKFLNFKKVNKSRYSLFNLSSTSFIRKQKKFDAVISCATLDSMPTIEIDATIKNVKDVLRKNGFFYLDLMSINQKRKGKFINKYDQLVNETHETGTIQSYWDMKRINLKFKDFKKIDIKKITTFNNKKIINERFYCVFRKF